MVDFVRKFHNLEGDLIPERKKSFFKLLKDTSLNSTQSDIENAIQNLHPKSYQEKLFWVHTLIYFKKTLPLIELLKQGNREYVKMIVRQKWFIEEAFKNISAEELVNDFFPSVSYSTRLKLLRRIPIYWQEGKVDSLFDAVEKRYGFYNALGILHVCSISKIGNLFKENEIILSAYQVVHIFERSQELFKIYLDHTNNLFKKPYGEQSVINLLAYNNPLLFLQLLSVNKITTGMLPKAASVKIIRIVKKEVLEKPEKFFKILNIRALSKHLPSDFKSFYKSLFPEKIKDINSHCRSVPLLKHFPKNIRWDLLQESFNTNFPEYTIKELFLRLDSKILELKLSKDFVQKWAEINYTSTNDEKFLQYYETSVSIGLIKEKINVTSDKEKRLVLLQLLITACAETKDMEALDRVLKYIESRHKNEDAYVHRKFIEFLCETFDNGELSKRHWDYIRKQTILIRARGTLHFCDFTGVTHPLLKYSYENDKELFRAVATDFIQDSAELALGLRVYLGNPELECAVFAEFCKLFPSVIPSDHKHFGKNQSSLIVEFGEMCLKYPQHCLNLREFPYLLSVIEAVINKEKLDYSERRILKFAILYHITFPQYPLPFLNNSKVLELLVRLNSLDEENYGDIVRRITKKITITELEHIVLLHFLEHMNIDNVGSWIIDDIVENLFLYRPRLLISSFEKVYSKVFIYNYIREVKHYSHLGLDKMLCDYLKKNWSKDKENQPRAVDILQNLLPEDDFFEFVNKHFCPDESSEEVSVKLQNHIEDLLINVNDAQKFLPLVFKFCKGDYLDRALPTLYSLFYRLPENNLHPHLETLSKQSTLRKHAVFLSCEMLDYVYISTLLNQEYLNTKSFSKCLCLATLKYFAKNSSEELFILFKKNLKRVGKSEKQVFSTLVKVKIPKQYKGRYIEVCWQVFENIDEDKMKVKYLNKLLEYMFEEDILKSLNSYFIDDLIKRYFPVFGKNRLAIIDDFAIIFLSYSSTEKPSDFKLIFDILAKLNKQKREMFCTKFIDFVFEKKPQSIFINTFIENWNKRFLLTDALDENITFNMLYKYSANTFANYAKAIVDYLEQLFFELGPSVFEIFKNSFNKILIKMNKIDQYNVLYFMLNYKSSTAICVLVILLLTPMSNDEGKNFKITYDKITKILNEIDEPIVISYCEIYLRKN